MVSVETLREHFGDLGVEPDDEVVEKCENSFPCDWKAGKVIKYFLFTKFAGLDLCSEYNIDDPEQFVDKWMAFSINKFAGAEPTVQYLTDFENNELKNKNPVAKSKRSAVPEKSQIKVYHQDSEDEENDLLGNYVCITPKVSPKSCNS